MFQSVTWQLGLSLEGPNLIKEEKVWSSLSQSDVMTVKKKICEKELSMLTKLERMFCQAYWEQTENIPQNEEATWKEATSR